ncbi:MAG: glycosyltransferase family 4 protein [Myxococcales bacterium]|nr:glycosyltransferase family 4 protein [Myxococcales bacterium]
MHILVVSQFFEPEMGAPAARFGDFAKAWMAAGHRVTVLTTWPNFPSGVIDKPYRQLPWSVERKGLLSVIRTPVLAVGGHSAARKALLYGSFAVSSLLQGALRDLQPDIVVGTTPPPTVGYVSALLAKRFAVPHVLDVRDIWPEAVINAGRVRASIATDALDRANRLVLGSAAAITTVSSGKRTRLIALGAPSSRVHLVANGVDLQRFDAQRTCHLRAARARLKTVAPTGKTILYAGVLNPAQGLDLLLDVAAARQTRSGDPVNFVLVGDGVLRSHLSNRVADERLGNVHIVGPLPPAHIAALYDRAWAGLVMLRPRKDTHTIPLKIYEVMASGRPVLLSADGEVADIAAQANCGPVSAAGDMPGLQANIDALLADALQVDAYGAAGRAFVRAHNDSAQIATHFLKLMEACR